MHIIQIFIADITGGWFAIQLSQHFDVRLIRIMQVYEGANKIENIRVQFADDRYEMVGK